MYKIVLTVLVFTGYFAKAIPFFYRSFQEKARTKPYLPEEKEIVEKEIIRLLLVKKQELMNARHAIASREDIGKQQQQRLFKEAIEPIKHNLKHEFHVKNIFNKEFLFAESLLFLSDIVIIGYVKTHCFEASPAFRCPMQVRLDLFDELTKKYAQLGSKYQHLLSSPVVKE